MNPSGILRRLKDLDQLEKRVKALTNPNQKMIQAIETERKILLNGENENETLPRK